MHIALQYDVGKQDDGAKEGTDLTWKNPLHFSHTEFWPGLVYTEVLRGTDTVC